MPSIRSLYIVAKPPPEQAKAMVSSPYADPARSADLAHITLFVLEQMIDEVPASVVAGCSKLLNAFRMQPFDVVFDLVQRMDKHIELVSTRPLCEAKTLRQLLIDHLIDRAGLSVKRPGKLRPHVTLHYNRPGKSFTASIDPIQWRVDEILLIESVIGQTRHITHGRWPLLRGDGSASEYGLPLFRT